MQAFIELTLEMLAAFAVAATTCKHVSGHGQEATPHRHLQLASLPNAFARHFRAAETTTQHSTLASRAGRMIALLTHLSNALTVQRIQILISVCRFLYRSFKHCCIAWLDLGYGSMAMSRRLHGAR